MRLHFWGPRNWAGTSPVSLERQRQAGRTFSGAPAWQFRRRRAARNDGSTFMAEETWFRGGGSSGREQTSLMERLWTSARAY